MKKLFPKIRVIWYSWLYGQSFESGYEYKRITVDNDDTVAQTIHNNLIESGWRQWGNPTKYCFWYRRKKK